ncbi:hypothetical protein [Streptomyces yerevanensis]|uniref:hypothetical protein n=1 Tax=Streptomyces yerevanensis TaxID=66378 RepID=UPI000524055A|nr:hypothetical protein [Streptomyces yerevanensis]
MTVEQLPGQVREFAQYLKGLLTRLDQGGGWCAVFWQRDPEGMRACMDGWEVPPWDVVEALLQDLAAAYGDRAATQETERARVLHRASLAAYDARPGGREALGDRLDVMLREQRYAAERQAELTQSLRAATSRDEVDSIRLDLAWARDDHERATARCAEIQSRLDELNRRTPGGHAREAMTIPPGDGGGMVWVDEGSDGGEGSTDDGYGGSSHGRGGAYGSERAAGGRVGAPRREPIEDDWPDIWRDSTTRRAAWQPDAGVDTPAPMPASPSPEHASPSDGRISPADSHPVPSTPTAPAAPKGAKAAKQRSKRRPRGSARFAGIEADTGASAVPAMPAPAATERSPRGVRYAGATEEVERRPSARREPLDDDARRATVETVQRLVRLRGEGRSGEAHVLLAEAAYWPAARFPLLAAELHRAGLGADWSTLLWEAVSLPADRLVAAADALAAAGRTADGRQMLRQGVTRPASEIGEAVLALAEDGRDREVRALLDAYVRVRTPEEAARSAAPDPARLAPLLLEAAKAVSEERHWDLVHALRVAGYTG